ncbi:MAG TPA: response regulator [Kofleriaceae bacterium]|nr:response regulator [Kofleriaceae bacterium]
MLDTRTLVLDDDATMVEALVGVLHDTVRQIDQAVDCERALELFAAHRHSVVVLDYKMPKMDGFEVMHRIHLLEPKTQVIMVTGFPSIECAKEAVNRHAFGFLIKPFAAEDIRRMVVEAFADYQGRSDLRDAKGFDAVEAEIEMLYQQAARLSAALDRSPGDPALEAACRESFERLRRAQAREAELASRAFRDNLALRKGMGYSSIEAARRVLDRDKDSA